MQTKQRVFLPVDLCAAQRTKLLQGLIYPAPHISFVKQLDKDKKASLNNTRHHVSMKIVRQIRDESHQQPEENCTRPVQVRTGTPVA
ncbi:hypothetical protein F2P81_022314 [Scophthalmus maximus]|uniref:Uncharacterized protein n=1 Tax=Scophthalmus maximus TaxID=52904 RepID=A0A6A4RTY5_SCOMX|nr:hypothetical protein F2P81_022314 [Scophthalmus maximus]